MQEIDALHSVQGRPIFAVRNANEKTGTVAVTETGATGIVPIALYSLSDFKVVGVILLKSAYQNHEDAGPIT